jgi:ectoine hydroxylase-related dioxygenase (phytanoyl-CoA dioxygenase family)
VPGDAPSFASGSHRLGSLGDLFISDHSHTELARRIAELGLATETHGALRAGDATFHAGWTLHSAGGNPTAAMREVMTVIYFADGTRVAAADHPVRAHDLRAWLRPCRPGDLAAGELNPRLWP